MLADISLETEFKIHEITILLLRIQDARRFRSVSSGRGIEPSMKPILFLADSVIVIAQLQEP